MVPIDALLLSTPIMQLEEQLYCCMHIAAYCFTTKLVLVGLNNRSVEMRPLCGVCSTTYQTQYMLPRSCMGLHGTCNYSKGDSTWYWNVRCPFVLLRLHIHCIKLRWFGSGHCDGIVSLKKWFIFSAHGLQIVCIATCSEVSDVMECGCR